MSPFLASVLTLIMCCSISLSSQSRILGIMTSPFKSMNNFMRAIFVELSGRGHDVTVLTSFIGEVTLENYREIQIEAYDFMTLTRYKEKVGTTFITNQHILWTAFLIATEITLKSPSIQNFTNNDHSHFDLVISEEFYQQAYYMFAHKYKAPLILVHTFGHAHYLNHLMGNPLELSYEAHECKAMYAPLDIWERMNNMLSAMWDVIVGPMYKRGHDDIAAAHFKSLPKPLPKVQDLEKNASILLVNSHFTLDIPRPLIPNVIDVGGLHIMKPKPLPDDLKRLLNASKHGVIYFSLGSITQSAELPKDIVRIFLDVFSTLKETVLWKWEEDSLEGVPRNVIIRKWMPQNDILGHPKVKLFISQGGALSLQEAVYHAVPVIGIPGFADHFRNMKRTVLMGFGEELLLDNLSVELLNQTIQKLLNDPKYGLKVKELSLRFKDKPQTAMETAMYWIEYVLRHKGAYFMKPPSVWMPWYQYYLVDIAILLITSVLLVLLSLWIILKKIYYQYIKMPKLKND